VTVYRQDFSEEVCGVNKARKEDKTEKVLTSLDACRLTWSSSV
jgi:hypothetical protein